MTETGKPNADRKLITHARVGKLINLPGDVVEVAAMQRLVDCVKHQGQWYMFDPDDLPERDQVIAAIRHGYRDSLRAIDSAADAVLAELEAIQDDARDALEHYIDPVGEFGDDLAMVLELRQATALRRYLDHLRDVTWDARALHRCLYLLDHPNPRYDSDDEAILPPPRPRRAQRPGPGR